MVPLPSTTWWGRASSGRCAAAHLMAAFTAPLPPTLHLRRASSCVRALGRVTLPSVPSPSVRSPGEAR